MSTIDYSDHAPGVYYDQRRGAWRVRVMHQCFSHHGGYFPTQEEAEVAAANLRRDLHSAPEA
ncbi:MAG: hypothetical protein ACTIJJ_05680 [Galactobacter sp.]